MAEITEAKLSEFKQLESFDNEILRSFYNDEISLNREDYPSEIEFKNVMSQLVSLLSSKTPTTIVEILKPDYQHKEVKTADIPQFSDLSSALYLTPEILQSLDHGNLSYEEMGKLLWPTERLAVADMKYGENHAKTASQIGLTTVIKGKINLSSFGRIFLSLNPVQQAALIPNLWLKVPLFYNYYCSNKSKQSLQDDLNILSDSTQKRRLSNIRTIINLIDKGYYLRENNILLDDIKEDVNERVLNLPLQVIYYGAPGTGKSFEIDSNTDDENSVRTTFHPDSDYASFVGAYKPTMEDVPISAIVGKEVHAAVPQGNHTGKEKKIVYKYVPQAFLKAYVASWKDLSTPQYLVIEEINRGNCAQIFGDLFQLLDRNNSGASSYPIHADEDIKQFLKDDKKGFAGLSNEQRQTIAEYSLVKDNGEERKIGQQILNGELLLLPPNLHIWATMNTSDQSLFPIDSAFKRRWDWKYIPISYTPKDKKNGKEINWKFNVGENLYSWGEFLSKINPEIYTLTESSDKQMGYFFAKANPSTGIISEDVFLNKVLFYLWTEVFKDFDISSEVFKNTKENRSFRFTDFFEDEDALSNFITNLELVSLTEEDGEELDEINGKEEEEDSERDLTPKTEMQKWYQGIWTKAKNKYLEDGNDFNVTPNIKNWYEKSLGLGGVVLENKIIRKEEACTVGVYFYKSAATKYYSRLLANKEDIEKDIPFELIWEGPTEKRGCASIRVKSTGYKFKNPEDIDRAVEWMVNSGIKIEKVFTPYLESLK